MIGTRYLCACAALTLLITLPGCDQGGDSESTTARVTDTQVEQLKSLPYLSGAPTPDDATSGLVVFDEERACPGYRLYTIAALGRAELISTSGDVVRRWERPDDLWMRAELLPGGDLLVVGVEGHSRRKRQGVSGPIRDSSRYVMRLDWSGEIVWRRKLQAHHDVELTPDGNLLVLAFERRKDARVHESLDVRDERLTLMTTDGEPLESKSMLDAALKRPGAFPLQRIEPFDTVAGRWVDVFHANSAEWMRRESLFTKDALYGPDNILMCFRNQDRVAILDWRKGEFVWSWGRGEISGPHDAQVLDSGNILLFDNGLSRGWSRAIELNPLTREIVWTYEADPRKSFYTVGRGSAQRLPNGNTLLAESDKGRAIEVADDGTVVWEFLCPYDLEGQGRATIVRMIHHPAQSIERLPDRSDR